MRMYKYTAIIAKTTITQGKVTFTEKRAGVLPLGSECITGHVLADSPELAKAKAVHVLKQLYPEERGYKVPDDVRVEELEETIVEVHGGQ